MLSRSTLTCFQRDKPVTLRGFTLGPIVFLLLVRELRLLVLFSPGFRSILHVLVFPKAIGSPSAPEASIFSVARRSQDGYLRAGDRVQPSHCSQCRLQSQLPMTEHLPSQAPQGRWSCLATWTLTPVSTSDDKGRTPCGSGFDHVRLLHDGTILRGCGS
ncbi:hypothetical protein CC79DRAFT_158511 [Sarocladium strictum]